MRHRLQRNGLCPSTLLSLDDMVPRSKFYIPYYDYHDISMFEVRRIPFRFVHRYRYSCVPLSMVSRAFDIHVVLSLFIGR